MEQKKKKQRCEFKECKTFINSLMAQKCKCGKMFCSNHKFFDSHNCTFDYVGEQRNILSKTIQKIEFEKISKIDSQEDNDNNKKEKRKIKLRTINPSDFLDDFAF
jgi:hypothetical protein